MKTIETILYKQQLEKAWAMLQALCKGTERWHMSIPAQPGSDPDLVLADGLHAGQFLLEAFEACNDRIRTLERKVLKLNCLLEAGVDNWEGYSIAMENYNSEVEKRE